MAAAFVTCKQLLALTHTHIPEFTYHYRFNNSGRDGSNDSRAWEHSIRAFNTSTDSILLRKRQRREPKRRLSSRISLSQISLRRSTARAQIRTIAIIESERRGGTGDCVIGACVYTVEVALRRRVSRVADLEADAVGSLETELVTGCWVCVAGVDVIGGVSPAFDAAVRAGCGDWAISCRCSCGLAGPGSKD